MGFVVTCTLSSGKRGVCLTPTSWFGYKEKLHSADVDRVIRAELPNPSADPDLFETVKTQMVHGPCGALNPRSPCMKDGKCSKKYPKRFVDSTQTDGDGYPLYRRLRPDLGGLTVTVRAGRHDEAVINNSWIVPYSPLLSKVFNAHINVEFCNSVKSIKYICKYINKGSDAAMYSLTRHSSHDEITQFEMGRYISSNEAFWRIFGFDIHCRFPAVVHLSVHLENGQRVYFTDGSLTDQLQNPRDTTLTAFFKLCQQDVFARTLFYIDVPSYYIWKMHTWARRKKGMAVEGHSGIKCDLTLGRIYTVHPSQQECFYLRMLLHEVRGPTSFADLRTVDGTLCSTYRSACMMRGLLENDNHWENTIAEAVLSNTPTQLRRLLALLLRSCELTCPYDLWLKFRNDLCEDFRYQLQLSYTTPMLTSNLVRPSSTWVSLQSKTPWLKWAESNFMRSGSPFSTEA